MKHRFASFIRFVHINNVQLKLIRKQTSLLSHIAACVCVLFYIFCSFFLNCRFSIVESQKKKMKMEKKNRWIPINSWKLCVYMFYSISVDNDEVYISPSIEHWHNIVTNLDKLHLFMSKHTKKKRQIHKKKKQKQFNINEK